MRWNGELCVYNLPQDNCSYPWKNNRDVGNRSKWCHSTQQTQGQHQMHLVELWWERVPPEIRHFEWNFSELTAGLEAAGKRLTGICHCKWPQNGPKNILSVLWQGGRNPNIFFLVYMGNLDCSNSATELVECLSEYIAQDDLEGFSFSVVFLFLTSCFRKTGVPGSGLLIHAWKCGYGEWDYVWCTVYAWVGSIWGEWGALSDQPCQLDCNQALVGPQGTSGAVQLPAACPCSRSFPVSFLLLGTAVVLVLGTLLVFTRYSMSKTHVRHNRCCDWASWEGHLVFFVTLEGFRKTPFSI